jgi:hypothetical protein
MRFHAQAIAAGLFVALSPLGSVSSAQAAVTTDSTIFRTFVLHGVKLSLGQPLVRNSLQGRAEGDTSMIFSGAHLFAVDTIRVGLRRDTIRTITFVHLNDRTAREYATAYQRSLGQPSGSSDRGVSWVDAHTALHVECDARLTCRVTIQDRTAFPGPLR